MSNEIDDVQPNQGWGELCVTCKHVFTDEKKYITMSPAFPCRKMIYRGRVLHGPALTRMADGKEQCPEFEPLDTESRVHGAIDQWKTAI